MAHVSRPGERAQLFLVGALSLAVLFVVLALLLNTAIYTENLATRSGDADDRAAVDYRAAVESGAGGIVEYANHHNDTSHDALAENVTAGVAEWAAATGYHAAYDGRLVNASVVSTADGTRIGQDDASRNFTAGGAEDGAANWTLAAGVENARAFRLNVTRDELATSRSDGFRVRVADGTDEWTTYLYNDSGRVSVAVENATGVSADVCAGPAEDGGAHVVVDLTSGTVAGEDCPLLEFGEDVTGPYDVTFNESDRAAGTYGLVVDSTSIDGQYYDGGGQSPYETPAIYAATVELSYESSETVYRTSVRVAPGEPDA